MLFKRITRNPFKDDAVYVVAHTSHHKVGTSWFRCVFDHLSVEFGLPIYYGKNYDLPRDQRVLYFQSPAIISPASLPEYRGSHMIRDPRDVVVSGYHYHLWTSETWATTKIGAFAESGRDIKREWPLLPLDHIEDMTYQEYLKSLSREEGIRAEIQRSSTTSIKEMVEWDYDDKNTFEFKYEEIMRNEPEVFRSMFRHFGFKRPHWIGPLRSLSVAASVAGRGANRARLPRSPITAPENCGNGRKNSRARTGNTSNRCTARI